MRYRAIPGKSGWIYRWEILSGPSMRQTPRIFVTAGVPVVVDFPEPRGDLTALLMNEVDDGVRMPLGFMEDP